MYIYTYMSFNNIDRFNYMLSGLIIGTVLCSSYYPLSCSYTPTRKYAYLYGQAVKYRESLISKGAIKPISASEIPSSPRR